MRACIEKASPYVRHAFVQLLQYKLVPDGCLSSEEISFFRYMRCKKSSKCYSLLGLLTHRGIIYADWSSCRYCDAMFLVSDLFGYVYALGFSLFSMLKERYMLRNASWKIVRTRFIVRLSFASAK